MSTSQQYLRSNCTNVHENAIMSADMMYQYRNIKVDVLLANGGKSERIRNVVQVTT